MARTGSVTLPQATALRLCALLLMWLAALAPAQARPMFSAVTVDAHTGNVLFARDADGLRHPASLTKVMTLYILFQEMKAGRLSKDSQLVMSRRAAGMAPTKLGVAPGKTYSVDTAIRALVTRSANDIAASIGENISGSEAAFADRMTRTARSIGMSRSTFRNASGLPNPGQITTARDMATLSLRVQRDFPQYYPYFSIPSFNYRGQIIKTHNKLLAAYAGTDGIKTGYIGASGFNLTSSVQRGGKRLVGVVMGATSSPARNRYMMSMLDAAWNKCQAGNGIVASVGRPLSGVQLATVAEPDDAVAGAPAPQTDAEDAIVPKSKKGQRNRGLTRKKSNSGRQKVVMSELVAEANAPASSEPEDAAAAGAYSGIDPPAPAQESPAPAMNAIAAAPAEPAATAPEMPAKLPFKVKSPGKAQAGGVVIVAARPAPVPPAAEPVVSPVPETVAATPDTPTMAEKPADTGIPEADNTTWVIQVGAYPDEASARASISLARSRAQRYLSDKRGYTMQATKNEKRVYRARFAGFSKKDATAACQILEAKGFGCVTFAPQL